MVLGVLADSQVDWSSQIQLVGTKLHVHLIYYLKFENSFLLPLLKPCTVALYIVIYNSVLFHGVQLTIPSYSH